MKETEVYKKLKHLRKERGLSLNDLAEKIGADYQQISRIERGKSRLNIDTLMKMAEALDTPVSDIVKAPPPKEKKVASTQSLKPNYPLTQELLYAILENIENCFSRI